MEKAKTEVEKKVSKILKYIQTKNKIPKETKKELISLFNDLQEECESLYSIFDDLHQGLDLETHGKRGKPNVSSSSSSSDWEYYSSEETESNSIGLKLSSKEVNESDNNNELKHKLEALNMEYGIVLTKLDETELTYKNLKRKIEEIERQLSDVKVELKVKIDKNDELGEKNEGLNCRIIDLESILKEKSGEISNLMDNLGKSEVRFTLTIEDLKSQMSNLQREIDFVNAELGRSIESKKKVEVELMNEVNDLKHRLEKKTEEFSEAQMRLKHMEERVKVDLKILEEKEDLLMKMDKLKLKIDNLEKQQKGKIIEIDQLKEENQNLKRIITEMESSQKEKNIEEKEYLLMKMDKLKLEIDNLEKQEKCKTIEIGQHKEENRNLKRIITEMESLQKEKNVEEKEDLLMKIDKLELEIDIFEKQKKGKNIEIDQLKEENQNLKTRITEMESSQKAKNIEEKEDLLNKMDKLKLEIDNLEKHKKGKIIEIDQLKGENQNLKTRITEMESSQKEKGKKNVEDLLMKMDKLKLEIDNLHKQEKGKIIEIDQLKEENQNLKTRITEIESLQKEKNIEEIENESKNLDKKLSDQQKLVKEQEDIIMRLSAKIKDQQKLLKDQKDTIDKFSEDQKLVKRWSFGSTRDTKLNPNLLERKMEELAEDFRMKMEDHIRILYRRIHVAEQIHLESKNNYIKTRDNNNNQTKGKFDFFETHFKKMKEMFEQEDFRGSEMTIKKVKEVDEYIGRIIIMAKEIDKTKIWVLEKKNEVETLAAKLECSEAQESLLKEKLSKLETKLAEEGTEKLEMVKVMKKFEKRIKEIEIDLKEKKIELENLGEEKRDAIRQLCVLVDYQRSRYDDLKRSIFLKPTLKS